MKCKAKRDMRDEKRMRTKNGRSGISGICTVCGGKMFKMVGGGAKATGKAKLPSKQRSKKVGKVKHLWEISKPHSWPNTEHGSVADVTRF